MREEYEYLLNNERRINRQLQDRIKDLEGKLYEEISKRKEPSIIHTKKIQTNKIDQVEVSCQTLKDNSLVDSTIKDPSYLSIASIKSTATDQGKIRNMHEQMMNLQEQVVELKQLNKTLKKEGAHKGKQNYSIN